MNCLSFALLFFGAVSLATPFEDGCFTAAVYEHVHQGNESLENPRDVVGKNLQLYDAVAILASAAGAQIIVYPEDGIFTASSTRAATRRYLETIPDQMNTFKPCKNDLFLNQTILSGLSCIAEKLRLYVVGHMGEVISCNQDTDKSCPTDGFYHYNTAVVFDSRGYLIAKYHKYHRYSEFAYDIPKAQEFVSFETPFGKFGLVICFDLIFENPGIKLVDKYRVDTIAFPTWWYDEAPLLAAHQFQQAWAIRNRVNLLAADVDRFWLGTTGSGIYSGSRGAVIYKHNVFNQTANLLIASLNVNSSSAASCDKVRVNIPIRVPEYEKKSELSYSLIQLNLSIFEHVPLKKKQDHVELCQNGTCCSLRYNFKNNPTNFFFGAANRIRIGEYGYRWCEQMCVLFSYDVQARRYLLSNTVSPNSVELRGNFSTPYIYPSATTANLELLQTSNWVFKRQGAYAEMVLRTNTTEVNTLGLYARCYNQDPPFP